MAFTKEQLKEYRLKLKERGICTRCHKRKVINNRSICLICCDEKRELRNELKKKGICKDCGKELDGSLKVRCRECYKKLYKLQKLIRKDRREKGLCRSCGTESDGKWLCVTCAEVANKGASLRLSL